jgi:hypothetical protein
MGFRPEMERRITETADSASGKSIAINGTKKASAVKRLIGARRAMTAKMYPSDNEPKSNQGAEQYGADDRQRREIQNPGDPNEGQGNDAGCRRGETVHAIDDVDSIDERQEPEEGNR